MLFLIRSFYKKMRLLKLLLIPSLLLLLLLLLLLSNVHTEECITPQNKTGVCVSIYNCSSALLSLTSENPDSIALVRTSSCDGTAAYDQVCCPLKLSHKIFPILADGSDRLFCGFQHSDDYFHASSDTGINEFPWMTRIKCYGVHESDTSYDCSGSIINHRYVLTAASCVKYCTSVEVSLGEYDIKNDTDCTEDGEMYECSDPVADIGIERVVMHSGYTNYTNDIALLRLNTTLMFTDYIRPICLPDKRHEHAKAGAVLLSSGWGLVDADVMDLCEIKKKTLNMAISHEECALMYGYALNVTESQFCTIQFSNNTDFQCAGDGGGPIMGSRFGRWHQDGIISLGMGACDRTYPDVHTKVSAYLDWIDQNLEPY